LGTMCANRWKKFAQAGIEPAHVTNNDTLNC
jgi:hypothetical protein